MQYQQQANAQAQIQIQRYKMFISLALRTFSAFTVAADADVADVTSPKPDEKKNHRKEIKQKKKIVNCPHGNCQPATATPVPPHLRHLHSQASTQVED